jgi:hypothetical protein
MPGVPGELNRFTAGIIPGERPPPPRELTEEQAAIWVDLVNQVPVGFFEVQSYPLLMQLCRHIQDANFLRTRIDLMMKEVTQHNLFPRDFLTVVKNDAEGGDEEAEDDEKLTPDLPRLNNNAIERYLRLYNSTSRMISHFTLILRMTKAEDYVRRVESKLKSGFGAIGRSTGAPEISHSLDA